MQRNAGSQAGWALITGGVNEARVETHRLHQLLSKMLKAVESSEEKELIYQLVGDILVGLPEVVGRLESRLDETSYALSLLGTDHLKDRLPLSSRARIDATVETAPPIVRLSRIVSRHLRGL